MRSDWCRQLRQGAGSHGTRGAQSRVEVDPQQLRSELILGVRENIGAVASFLNVEVVAKLPKTRLGKILRATMRAIADGREYTVPGTIEDATVLEGITEVVAPKARTS
jgi:propionyl-CoA synthetase